MSSSRARRARCCSSARSATRPRASASGRVIAADHQPARGGALRGRRRADHPPLRRPRVRRRAASSCARPKRIGLVVPTRDEELPVLARRARALRRGGDPRPGLGPGRRRDVPGQGALRRRRSARLGSTTPAVYPDEAATRFPAFVKPRPGQGRSGRGEGHERDRSSPPRLDAPAAATPSIQAFVDAPEFTIDVFLDLDGRPISCVPRERVAVVDGESIVGADRARRRSCPTAAARAVHGDRSRRAHDGPGVPDADRAWRSSRSIRATAGLPTSASRPGRRRPEFAIRAGARRAPRAAPRHVRGRADDAPHRGRPLRPRRRSRSSAGRDAG